LHELNLPSPLERFTLSNYPDLDIWVKRDDKIHHIISGNKWRKLKYQFKLVTAQSLEGVVTFGGAFSNHIVATAEACRMMRLKSVGIIRAEASAIRNPSLSQAQDSGMQIQFVNRTEYRLKENSSIIRKILNNYPNYLLINEGGFGFEAFKGIAEAYHEIVVELDQHPDYLLCSVGTAASYIGLSKVCQNNLIGFNALRNEKIQNEVIKHHDTDEIPAGHVLMNEYHIGGYAKYSSELIQFMHQLYAEHGVPTDVVYTGKLFYGFFDLLSKGYFKKNSSIVIYHSGGLQGNDGMNFRHPGLINF